MKTRYVLIFVAIVIILVAWDMSHGRDIPNKSQMQLFRFDVQASHNEATKENFNTLTPYVPLSLGVEQIEGPKHQMKEPVQCSPGGPEEDHILKLYCTDGSKFKVIGVVFPKGNQ